MAIRYTFGLHLSPRRIECSSPVGVTGPVDCVRRLFEGIFGSRETRALDVRDIGLDGVLN